MSLRLTLLALLVVVATPLGAAEAGPGAPQAATLAIGDVTVTEGDSGSTDATFTITLSEASTDTVTVGYTTADGSALAPDDYTAASGTLTFLPGETTQTVPVGVKGDVLDEEDETFEVDLSSAVNATIDDGVGVGTITDDDPPPALSVDNVTVTEGNGGNVSANFNVTLNVPSGRAISVDYATANGTAIAPGDYAATAGTLTFAAGETAKQVTVQVHGDTLDEANETYSLNLSNAVNAAIADGTGTGTITDDDPPPTLSINDVSATEGDSGTVAATFTVSLSPASGRTVTVAYGTVNNTAVAPGDYTAMSGTLTFTPGQTSKTVTVFVNGDVIDEIDENYFVDLSDATNATIGDGRGVGTIIDDDDQPSISIGDATVTEGNGSTVNASFSVSLSSASGQTVSVGYATADGTATAGNDYVATGGSLVFSPGQTTKPVNVQVNGDTLDEIDETFTVDLADAVNAAIADGTGVGTIIDNDPLPTVSVNDVTVTEGDSGTVAATFTLGLNVPSGRSLSVDYATADVTATAPADYQASNGTATFAAGQTQQQVTVLVNGDLLDEANETFRLNLSNAVNVTIADGQGTGTITDNDPAPALSVNDVSAVEGDFGTVDATFTISLSAPSGQAVSVDYATADGTATAPADYTAANGTLTFAPGQTTKQVTVQIKSDLLDEANETYFVNLTNASNATISDAQGLGTITDNDPLPALSINDVTVTEGNAGTVAATFTVTLVPVSGRAVSVNYATANGTAQAPADYQAASGTLTFAAGQTTQTVTVLVNGDLLEEADETFLVNLTGPTNATLSDAQGVGTITNDDALPSFSIDDVTVTEGDTGTTNANFTVSLNAPSGRTVSVSYATADGTAHAPNDYQAAGDRLTFAAGQTTKTVTVLVKGDLLNENNETYFVNLSGPTNATITDGQGIGTIVDDDGLPSLSINDVAVTEGNSGTVDATFTVTLSAPSAQSVSIGFATHDGSAHAPDDYFSTGGNLVFNPGQTTKTVTVQVRGDLLDEPDENYFVDLSGPVNATIDDGQGLGTIRDDDAPQPPPAPTPPPPPPPPPPPAVRRAALYSPPAGTRVTIPPMLKWHRVRRARFYNLQLYRKGRKILSLWPSRANLKLHRRWTFAGRALRMTPGAYTWIVWPAYGSRTKPRYGSMLGQSTFRMVAKRRR